VAAGDGMTIGLAPADVLRFIFEGRSSQGGAIEVGGPDELSHLALNHLTVSLVAVAIAIAIAMPVALYLGHIARFEFFAVAIANVGRAVPILVLLAFFIAFVGVGFRNVLLALTLLAIPPIVTNTFVGVRQVDADIVDAARGQGLSELEIIRSVELPLALPTIFAGIRLSSVTVLATAIIAPLAAYETLGEPIISYNVYGLEGAVGAAILVTLLTLAVDGVLAALQRLLTPKGLKVAMAKSSKRSLLFLPRRRISSS
jgi:osmoprotectant transport system permease protein